MDSLMQSAEEAFVERYFDYGDDNDTAMANLESSLNVFFSSNRDCDNFAEQICNGEIVDIPTVTLALQNLIFAHKYEEQFKKSLGGTGTVLDIRKIDLTDKTAEELAREGNLLVADARAELNINAIEKGKYLLFAAMNM